MPRILEKLGRSLRDERLLPTATGQGYEPENKVMIEAFEWYSPADGQQWKRLRDALPSLRDAGIDRIWIPPACKAGWQGSNGYDVYDLYDLGEFDQKGSVGTKWGTKDELVALSRDANAQGIGLVFDAVLNHKAAADYTQHIKAQRVDSEDRRKASEKPQNIEAWLGYDFSGRNGTYSHMKYEASHFNGTNYNNLNKSSGIYRLSGKDWARDVDLGKGNYDFLLCNNLDLSHPDVKNDLKHWGQWVGQELNLAGFRFDAAKHMSQAFVKDYVQHLRGKFGKELLLVGEYCTYDNAKVLVEYIKRMNGQMSLFDFPLVRNFTGISRHADADLRFIFGGTLSERLPANSVTFVTNHDTQEREGMEESRIEDDFLPVAYAVILLNKQAGYPCVFWGDLHGVDGPSARKPSEYSKVISKLLMMRKLYAYGPQNDYFDDPSCVGFSRTGNQSHSNGAGVAVLISKNNNKQTMRMNTGCSHASERWTEALGDTGAEVFIDKNGYGVFPISATRGSGNVAAWCCASAPGRERVDHAEARA